MVADFRTFILKCVMFQKINMYVMSKSEMVNTTEVVFLCDASRAELNAEKVNRHKTVFYGLIRFHELMKS